MGIYFDRSASRNAGLSSILHEHSGFAENSQAVFVAL